MFIKKLKRFKIWICEKCTNDNDSENLDDIINNVENECESLINQYRYTGIPFLT